MTDHTLVTTLPPLHHQPPAQNLPMRHPPASTPNPSGCLTCPPKYPMSQGMLAGPCREVSRGYPRFFPTLKPCHLDPVASRGCHGHLDIFFKKQRHCKHIAIGGGEAPLLACIANNLRIPRPMIMVWPCVPPTGGFSVISCIHPNMTIKRILAALHCSIRLAMGSVATISWTGTSPSLLLRPIS